MGDRANIVVRSQYPSDMGDREAVFLYGHWSGFDLPEVLRIALAEGRNRWDDGSYLARIIFDRMVGQDQGAETGFGISTRLTDNEHDLLVLLIGEGRLVRLPEKAYIADGFRSLGEHPSITFGEYVSAPERTWDNLTDTQVTA